jgi:ligand-binding SRPBCC domain-containing protein
MLRFQFQTVVRATPEAVLRFHERPDAIILLTPRWQPVRVLSRKGGLEAGSEVHFRVWMGPLPITWIARHIEFDGPCGFADEQVQGPFQVWTHKHRFEAHPEGTLLVDAISCALPFAPLSHWLGGWLLGLQLKAMFRHRHAVTRKFCEALPAAGN